MCSLTNNGAHIPNNLQIMPHCLKLREDGSSTYLYVLGEFYWH